MRRVILAVILLAIIWFFSQKAYDEFNKSRMPAMLFLSGINRAETETLVLEHYKTILTEGEYERLSQSTTYEIDATFIDINLDPHKDLIIVLISEATCGSGGCIATLFTQTTDNTFVPVNFSYAVKQIETLKTYTNGMRDLRINDDRAHKMVWNGSSYVLESS